jgi:hypothetical protein
MRCAAIILILSVIFSAFISCQKELNYENESTQTISDSTNNDTTSTINTDTSYVDPNPATLNTWHFTDSLTNTFYEGNFERTTGKLFKDSLLVVWGTTNISPDTAFGITIYFNADNIVPGTYPFENNTHANTIDMEANYGPIYNAFWQSGEFGNSSSCITVLSYDSNTKDVTGSFHCWAYGYSAKFIHPLTLLKGSFNCIIQ